jgi:hypothetical protein
MSEQKVVNKLITTSVNKISCNPWNPHFANAEELEGLLRSMKKRGFVDPVTVVEWDVPLVWNGQSIGPTAPYLLVDGEQRYTAYSKGVSENALPDEISAVVLGALSEHVVEDLVELGQALNHVRGSGESSEKTRAMLEVLTKRKPLDVLAAQMGQKKSFLASTMTPKMPKPSKNKIERPESNKERGDLVVNLVFVDEKEVQEFNSRVKEVNAQLMNSGDSFGGFESARVEGKYLNSATMLHLLRRETKG